MFACVVVVAVVDGAGPERADNFRHFVHFTFVLAIVKIIQGVQCGELVVPIFIEHHHKHGIPGIDLLIKRFVHKINVVGVDAGGSFLDVVFMGVPCFFIESLPFRMLRKIHLWQVVHVNLIAARYNLRLFGRTPRCADRGHSQKHGC